MKVLRHDGAGITPRAVQRRIGHVIHQVVDAVVGRRGCRVQDGLEREGHVGAGIAVRNGKNVDAVQVFAALEQVRDAGRQRPQQARGVEIGNGCAASIHGPTLYGQTSHRLANSAAEWNAGEFQA